MTVPAAYTATLVLLLVHAWHYRFLCDDAFISFRYAANLAAGDGLVFNPGERVEGYSNFLWVLVLAAFRVVGGAPETVSQILSLLLTGVLWAEVAWFARRRDSDGWSLLPLVFLAATRSVAVWSTSGLETRLFEVLVVGAVLRLAVELEDGAGGRPAPVISTVAGSGLLFGLASLTRPDGPLIAVTTFAAAALVAYGRPPILRRVLTGGMTFSAITAAHFIFRWLYYGDWLPNTYYAKVGGQTWWSMGSRYLGTFLIEYAAWLWIPWIAAAVLFHRRRGNLRVPALLAAAVVPHLLYVVAIGGDHFEYRPFDLYFPFVFLLTADGARELARRATARKWLVGGLVVTMAGLTLLPWQAHRQFPGDSYRHGFPGLWTGADPAARRYLDPDRALLYRLPVLRYLAELHRDALRTLTAGFVGLRAEEHAQFLTTVVPEGRALRALVEAGELDPGTRIAIDAVGAIPFYSRLPVLDRLGLTDREVARSPIKQHSMLAHDKRATLEYGRDRAVALWAVHDVHLLWNATDLELHELLAMQNRGRFPVSLVRTSQGLLLALLPQGEQAAREALPGLEVRPLAESDRSGLAQEAADSYREAAEVDPAVRKRLARLLELQGLQRQALVVYERLLSDPSAEPDPGVLHAVARLGARSGDIVSAARRYGELIELGFGDADVFNNLGNVRLLEGRTESAIGLYHEALARDPERIESRLNLANALGRAGRPQDAAAEIRAVLALEPGHLDANLRMYEDRLSQGRPVAALGYLADALQAEPQSVEAREAFERLRRRLAGVGVSGQEPPS